LILRTALLAALVGVLLVDACGPSPTDDKTFDAKVKAYILGHPEVVGDAIQKLQAKMAADDAAAQAKASAQLPLLRAAVERDPHDFVANPAGAITVTEFYDYRCPHCINAAPKVLSLIKDNPDVRVVFKEMPIFGPVSEHAARAALAVKAAGGDYLGAYGSLMETRPLDDETIDQIALRFGARASDLRSHPAADTQLARTTALFNKLDLGGTPAFIVGDVIIPGEDMDAVSAAIAKARGKSAAAPA
jgi:protein-disulfide isomerase